MFFFSEFIENSVGNAQKKLSDIMRTALFQSNPLLFDLIEFENDAVFLEPSLFCFFLSEVDNKCKIPLEQILFGYIKEEIALDGLVFRSDVFGLVNLPNLGYLKIKPNTIIHKPVSFIKRNLISNSYAFNSKIRLCLHPTDHFSYQSSGVLFNEPIELSLEKHINKFRPPDPYFVST